MVCLESTSSPDEASVTATVRDTIYGKQQSIITLSPSKHVSTIFKEIGDEYKYLPDSFELVIQNNKGGFTVVLNKYKDKTLGELEISFDASERNTLMIGELRKSKTMALGSSLDDELILGASASPTSCDPPIGCTSIEFAQQQQSSSHPRIKDYRDDEPGMSWGESLSYVGLVNQAMTCYLNSLLQALYMTPEFRNALYNWEFDGEEEAKSIPFQLQKLFVNLQTSMKSAVETTELTRSFGWDMHEAWQQHDIQELCRVMFDALEHKFKDTRQANLINDLYEGKMLDYVKCLKCGTEKSRDDTFLDIPLPVRPFGSNVAYNSVEEALRAFVQPETLDGNNQYHCEKCNKKCDAHKGLKFIKFPYLLTLHLKRFDFDHSTLHRIKLNDKVVFPEILNLNSFIPTTCDNMENETTEERAMKCDDCSTTDSGSALDEESCQVSDISSTVNGQDDNCQEDDEGIDVRSENHNHENEKNRADVKGPYMYELFSIMIHSGSASGGHYYAYIKDFAKNNWCCFNDQTVSRITEDDIRKTYGGGPARGYYSGAYSSSTNAYMLMYRQIDKERNCNAITVDAFPAHIKHLLQQMRKMEEMDRAERERESDMFRGRVYCLHPTQTKLIESKLCFPHDTRLSLAVLNLHHQFKLDGVALENCRLVSYNKQQNCIDCSFEGDDLRFSDVAEKVKICHMDWFLEIKQPDAEFQVYKPGGVNMKVFFIDIESEEVDGPKNFRVNPGETVKEIKERLAKLYYLNVNHVQVVQEMFSNEPHHLEDDDEPIAFESNCNAYKLYVSTGLDEDPEKQFALSKLHKVIDRFVHVVTVEIVLPDTDVSTLESLSIPSLDFNQNLDHVDTTSSRERLNARASPQPSQGVNETFGGDQSNSEDSSLSDSDRTLVGDAPGDCIGLLSSSSNSPAEMRLSSSHLYEMPSESAEEMNWDDSPPEVPTKLPNYYFKDSVVNTVCYDDGEVVKSCSINVDKRTLLGRLKKHLEPIVGVPMEYFKIYTQLPYEVEWSRLSDSLVSLKDGDKLVIKLGRVLKRGEYSVKIYYLTPNKGETFTFLFELIVSKGETVGQLRKEVVLAAKKQHMMNVNLNRCRLRMKNNKNPGRILHGELRFDDDIPVANTFELFLQTLKEEERVVNAKQLCVFVRHWMPSTLTLGTFDEIVLDELTMDEFKRKIAGLSSIPVENVEIAYVKGNFPCDMNVLDIHGELDWNMNVPQFDSWLLQEHLDGSLFFYRDDRDNLKEMSAEQKKEINQWENTRLGKCSTKNYSPRRERPLKIYVLDNTPNKSDQACGD